MKSGPACCRGPAGAAITQTGSSQNEGQRLFLSAAPGERGAGPPAVGGRLQDGPLQCSTMSGMEALHSPAPHCLLIPHLSFQPALAQPTLWSQATSNNM